MSELPGMTAKEIKRLLHKKHYLDIAYEEVPTGGTRRAAGHVVFDFYAVRPSLNLFRATGYEIKVGRQDFVNDSKWIKSLPYCHEFYFVAPKGLIKPDELPVEAGLYEVATSRERLWLKKKAITRAVQIPETIFLYMLSLRTEKAACADTIRAVHAQAMTQKQFGR